MQSQSRRSFLKPGSLAGTTLLASSALGIFSGEGVSVPFNRNSGIGAKNQPRTLQRRFPV